MKKIVLIAMFVLSLCAIGCSGDTKKEGTKPATPTNPK